jgi:trimeric autotransporter adhesin
MGSILKLRFRKRCGLAFALAPVLLVAACSGFFIGSHDIASISVTPGGAFIMPQNTQQFTATATFGNNSTGDVTDQVTWTSSVPAIATIDSSGLATGVALGNTVIKARSSNGMTASVTLTVSNHTVTSIAVNPTSATINFSFGGQSTQAFTATATFSDMTSSDVTSQVSWTSSVPTVATISSSGVAQAVSTGTTTITAALGGQTGTASLTVQ